MAKYLSANKKSKNIDHKITSIEVTLVLHFTISKRFVSLFNLNLTLQAWKEQHSYISMAIRKPDWYTSIFYITLLNIYIYIYIRSILGHKNLQSWKRSYASYIELPNRLQKRIHKQKGTEIIWFLSGKKFKKSWLRAQCTYLSSGNWNVPGLQYSIIPLVSAEITVSNKWLYFITFTGPKCIWGKNLKSCKEN